MNGACVGDTKKEHGRVHGLCSKMQAASERYMMYDFGRGEEGGGLGLHASLPGTSKPGSCANSASHMYLGDYTTGHDCVGFKLLHGGGGWLSNAIFHRVCLAEQFQRKRKETPPLGSIIGSIQLFSQ